jgi:hypothetical protein
VPGLSQDFSEQSYFGQYLSKYLSIYNERAAANKIAFDRRPNPAQLNWLIRFASRASTLN